MDHRGRGAPCSATRRPWTAQSAPGLWPGATGVEGDRSLWQVRPGLARQRLAGLAAMSDPTYPEGSPRPLAVLFRGFERLELSRSARLRMAVLLERLRRGEALSMPESRPMPTIGPRCHELRIQDGKRKRSWRVVYRVDPDAVVLVDAFAKTTRATPRRILQRCRQRLARYDGA